MKLILTVNGSVFDVEVEVEEEPLPTLGAVQVGSRSSFGMTPTAAKAPATSANALTTPMVLEAMKMETEVTAPKDGKIKSVDVSVGDAVQGGQVLIEWDD